MGKSIKGEDSSKRFGLVHGYDTKSKRRVFETLQAQGLQMNQAITFLSDGADTVRKVQEYLSPQSEHILDWFHITMRITVMKQMAKRLPSTNSFRTVEEELERLKWFLWHGNVFKALRTLEDIELKLEVIEDTKPEARNLKKLAKAVSEFQTYISRNRNFIPNYADRYHYGEAISTAFLESTVNEVVSKRMDKRQQMRWTRKGAHLLLQIRIQTLNHELRNSFERWYPGMPRASDMLGKKGAEGQHMLN